MLGQAKNLYIKSLEAGDPGALDALVSGWMKHNPDEYVQQIDYSLTYDHGERPRYVARIIVSRVEPVDLIRFA